MGHGGSRVGAGRPKGAKGVRKQKLLPVPASPAETASSAALEPLDYMLKVMADPNADVLRRDRMAVAAAAYLHPKVGEVGSRRERSNAAKIAGKGKFAPAAPPKLVVVPKTRA